jgi:hypothetical protein
MASAKKHNPSKHFGNRNLECPQYAACLDVAVRHAWHTFSCGQCECRHQRVKVRIEEMDMGAPGWEDIWAQGGGILHSP